jgi:DNA-directed RNA polymerase subunit beta
VITSSAKALRKRNEDLKSRKKKRAEIIPYSFYLSAWEEDKYLIAQANEEMDKNGKLTHELVNVRQAGNFVLKHRNEVDYVDVSPKQLVSVAASLIRSLKTTTQTGP